MKPLSALFAATILLGAFSVAFSQETATPEAAAPAPAAPSSVPAAVSDAAGMAEVKAKEIGAKIDQNQRAQEVSAGILQQIYVLAEKMESPSFHWVAFALMVTGAVSFALQLVLGKLFVLARMSISLSEILSDIMGLAISLVGLVLTTQAAAQNSTFTTSPAAVLSSTALGAVLGFMFFRWGTSQELAAAAGRKGQPTATPVVKPKA